MYVKQGSRLVYVATVANRILLSPGEMISKVGSDLSNLHNIIIEESKSDVSVLHNSVDYTLNLLVNDTDYASEQDVRSIVDHYFYVEGGDLPQSSRIVSVRQPSGTVSDTGAPPPEDNGDNTPDNPSSPSWFDSLLTKLEAGSVGVIFGAAVVIGLIVFVVAKEAVE